MSNYLTLISTEIGFAFLGNEGGRWWKARRKSVSRAVIIQCDGSDCALRETGSSLTQIWFILAQQFDL